MFSHEKTQLLAKITKIGIDEGVSISSLIEFKVNSWKLLLQLVRDEVSDTAVLEKIRRK